MTADAYQENTYNGALEADNRTVGRNAYLTDEKSKSFVIDLSFLFKRKRARK